MDIQDENENSSLNPSVLTSTPVDTRALHTRLDIKYNMCHLCYAIPSITIQLIATSAAILYGQRILYKNSQKKWTKRITLTISILISILLSSLGVFLFVLSVRPEYGKRNFANLCMRQNSKSSPFDEHRCSNLANITGNVLEFGTGPGANFKCLENYTADELQSIEKYVAVEPNTYFEKALKEEHDARGLTFPLQFVGIKGEDIDIPSDEYDEKFDVVISTHVLCSVDSVTSVLENAGRALKPGGRYVFMEHVMAQEERSFVWYSQLLMAPILKIVGAGCSFRNLRDDIESYFGGSDRFTVDIVNFDAPMPKFMFPVRPHIKGIVTKK